MEYLGELGDPVAKIRSENKPEHGGTEEEGKEVIGSKLKNILYLSIGCKVMLRQNLAIDRGLVNGSIGILKALVYEEGKVPPSLPICIMVKFDAYKGPYVHEECFPIVPVSETFKYKGESYNRKQLPITVAHAVTVHKSQGLTVSKAVVALDDKEANVGLTYVQLSRVPRLTDLLILGTFTKSRLDQIATLERHVMLMTYLRQYWPNNTGAPVVAPITTAIIPVDVNISIDAQEPMDVDQCNQLDKVVPHFDPGSVGLINLGNTCFISSIVQCIIKTTESLTFLLSATANCDLVKELIELVRVIKNSSDPIQAIGLKKAVLRAFPDFRNQRNKYELDQEDSHEFWIKLFQVMNNEFGESHDDSVMTRLFNGVYSVACDKSQQSENIPSIEFNCLSLPVLNLKLPKSMPLVDCLANFVDTDCSKCGNYNAKKHITFLQLPKILVIQLLRFTSINRIQMKYNTLVSFSPDIFEIQDHSYTLYAVVNHSGNTVSSGHYYTFARNLANNSGWFNFNDEKVSTIRNSDVVTKNAYLLFYKKNS